MQPAVFTLSGNAGPITISPGFVKTEAFSWGMLNLGLPDTQVTAQAISSTDPSRVYTGTSNAGVFALLKVELPTITSQPMNITISRGQTATLKAVANGTVPLRYQWYQGEHGDTSSPIGGATESSYTTPPLNITTSFWLRVTDFYGLSADSVTVKVMVISQVYLPMVQVAAQ